MAEHRESRGPLGARQEFKHVGRLVENDVKLKEFARQEWANPQFRARMASRREEPAEFEDVLKEA
jgi:hypothetical protein